MGHPLGLLLQVLGRDVGGTELAPLLLVTGHLSLVGVGGSGFCVVVVVAVVFYVVVAVRCWSDSLSWLSGNGHSASQHLYQHTMSVV